MKNKYQEYSYLLVVFLSGVIVMTLELVASRMLAPVFGNSIYVWTSVLGVIMAALAVGYWLGGWISDKKLSTEVLSIIVLGAAFFVMTTALIGNHISYISHLGFDFRIGLLISTILLFFMPNLFFGMILPYCIRLIIENVNNLGKNVGKIYAISTIGSIAGTFLTGFVLIPNLGTRIIVWLIFLTLIFMACYINWSWKKTIPVFLMIILMIFSGTVKTKAANLLFEGESKYNHIRVTENTDQKTGKIYRYLLGNSNVESIVCMNCIQPENFYDKYRLIEELNPNFHNVLVLGGGGYSIVQDMLKIYPEVNIDSVEIDPLMTELAEEYMGLDTSYERLNIFHQDARRFLMENENKYDYIIVNTFLNTNAIPFHLTTVEFIKVIKEHLNDNGVVMVNMIGSVIGDENKFIELEYSSYSSVFNTIGIVPTSAKNLDIFQNVFLFAGENLDIEKFPAGEIVLPEYNTKIFLTDDWAPVESLLY